MIRRFYPIFNQDMNSGIVLHHGFTKVGKPLTRMMRIYECRE
jgi:hypothetical protein